MAPRPREVAAAHPTVAEPPNRHQEKVLPHRVMVHRIQELEAAITPVILHRERDNPVVTTPTAI